MTIRACQFSGFVNNNRFAFYDFRFVAFITGNFYMGAFQFEAGVVMVEIIPVPRVESMAFFAIRDAVFLKLISVGMVMATIAGRIQIFKYLSKRAIAFFFKMAGSTGSFRMFSG